MGEFCRRVRAYGLTISTDIDLGLPNCPQDRTIDLTIQRSAGRYDAVWDPAPEAVLVRHRTVGHSHICARVPGGYRIRFVDQCEFDINEGLDGITWRVAPGGDIGLVPILAGGAVLTFLFMLAGELVLHCSAVSLDGRGLAFVAWSGMGKSTMATLLCASGATLVTDDVGRVAFNALGCHLAVGGQETRLRDSAAHLADPSLVRHTADGRLAVALPVSEMETVPLEAIVIPFPTRDRDEVELTRLGARDAVIALSTFPRLAGVIDLDMRAQQFHRIAELAGRIQVFAAAIPWDLALSCRTAAELLTKLGWNLPVAVATGQRDAVGAALPIARY